MSNWLEEFDRLYEATDEMEDCSQAAMQAAEEADKQCKEKEDGR